MVRSAALVLLASTGLAAAEEPIDWEDVPPRTYSKPPRSLQPTFDPRVLGARNPPPHPDKPPPAHNKLGFRIGFGTLSSDERELHTFSLGLQIEHPVFTKARVFAEYELMWLGESDTMGPSTEGMPYTGHRSHLGIRAELLGKTLGGAAHFYLDAEIGGGLGVVSDDISGVQVLPHAFAGLRGGYDFLWGNKHAHSSRVFEAELLARAFRMPDGGRAVLFGIGMLWGD